MKTSLKFFFVVPVLVLASSACNKEKVEELIPQLPVKVVSATLYGTDITNRVFNACSNPPVLGYCDYDPQYTGQPTARFTATYTCGDSPDLYYATLGDNGFETSYSNDKNDVYGKTVRLSCLGNKLDPSKLVTIVSAAFGSSDATHHVKAMCIGAVGVCNFQPRTDVLGDPYPNRSKRMTITYRCGTSTQDKIVQYGQNDTGNSGNDATLKILSAQCP